MCLVLLWQQCDMLCTTGFVDDIIFTQWSKRAESKRTHVLSNLPGGDTSRTTRSPGGGTGGEVCRLRLHLLRSGACWCCLHELLYFVVCGVAGAWMIDRSLAVFQHTKQSPVASANEQWTYRHTTAKLSRDVAHINFRRVFRRQPDSVWSTVSSCNQPVDFKNDQPHSS